MDSRVGTSSEQFFASPDLVLLILPFLSGNAQVEFAVAVRALPAALPLLGHATRASGVVRSTTAVWALAALKPTSVHFDLSAPCFHEECSAVLAAAQACCPAELDVSRASLSWAGLDSLARCDGLKTLVARDAVIPRIPRAPWDFARGLRRLDVVGAHLPRGWSALPFSGLEEYAGCATPALVASLNAGCPRLRRLTLHSVRVCELRMDGRSWTGLLARLEALRLERCDLLPRAHLLQEEGAVLQEALAAAPALTALALIHTRRPPVSRALLRACLALRPGRLESLHIEPAPQLDDATVAEAIVRCQGAALRSLSLLPANPSLTDATAEAIAAGCRRLESLDLPCASQITDAGVLALASGAGAPQLRVLRLSRCSVMSGSTIGALAACCGALRELRLRGCHAACASGPGATALEGLRGRGVRVEYDRPAPRDAPSWGSECCAWGVARPPDWALVQQCEHGCGARIPLGDAADHAVVCPLALAACPLATHGCPARVLRASLSTHMAVCKHWIVTCACGCGDWCARGAAAALAESHAAAMDAAAMRRRCPLGYAGCAFEEGALAGVTVAEHLRSGACAAARYACASCGGPVPPDTGPADEAPRIRLASCDASDCRLRALLRGRFPQGPPACAPPPPALLLRGISHDAIAKTFPPPLPPPPAPRQLPAEMRPHVLAFRDRYLQSSALWARLSSDAAFLREPSLQRDAAGEWGVGAAAETVPNPLQARLLGPSFEALAAILRQKPIEVAEAALDGRVAFPGPDLAPDGAAEQLEAWASAAAFASEVGLSDDDEEADDDDDRVSFPARAVQRQIPPPQLPPPPPPSSGPTGRTGGAWAGPAREHRPISNPLHRLALQAHQAQARMQALGGSGARMAGDRGGPRGAQVSHGSGVASAGAADAPPPPPPRLPPALTPRQSPRHGLAATPPSHGSRPVTTLHQLPPPLPPPAAVGASQPPQDRRKMAAFGLYKSPLPPPRRTGSSSAVPTQLLEDSAIGTLQVPASAPFISPTHGATTVPSLSVVGATGTGDDPETTAAITSTA